MIHTSLSVEEKVGFHFVQRGAVEHPSADEHRPARVPGDAPAS